MHEIVQGLVGDAQPQGLNAIMLYGQAQVRGSSMAMVRTSYDGGGEGGIWCRSSRASYRPLNCPLHKVTYLLPYYLIEVWEYPDPAGRSPFEKWFSGLDAGAAAKITVALIRLEQGNRSNAKGVGGGVLELRIDHGPGYRVYFGKDGERLVILLGGGTKKRQSADIETARRLWRDYKARKKVELWH